VDAVVFGEIALSGEVRLVGHAETRLKEAIKLGFTKAWMPIRRGKRGEAAANGAGFETAYIRHLKELVDRLAPKRTSLGSAPRQRGFGVAS
jgi:DNA repair protein RadA/Sms